MANRISRRALAVTAAGVTVAIAGPMAVSATASPGQSRTGATAQQVRSLFDGWNRALATGDPQRVADRYARDAVLVPTVSNDVRTDRASIVDYFEHFLDNEPQAVITESHVNVLDPTTAVDTGTYRFTLGGPAGERTVDARYTFVYELRNGKWLIVNHHSSAMPAPVTAR
ncbi:SgcJ/EcaC family oxidoreductase [Actinoplanes sp. G11-F43]|uniref:SgcJ/EcaC family oxidoreductase n=1 Tax=Actinoplanes sp. G11-F43 TaxID=3424130 RepID=UPI003D34A9B6